MILFTLPPQLLQHRNAIETKIVELQRFATLDPAWMHAWSMTVLQKPFAAPLSMTLNALVGLVLQEMDAQVAAGVS